MQTIPHVPLVSSLQVLDKVLRQVAEFSSRLASNVLHLIEVLASLRTHPSSCHHYSSMCPCRKGPRAANMSQAVSRRQGKWSGMMIRSHHIFQPHQADHMRS